MISLSNYNLDESERSALRSMLSSTEGNLSLEQLWGLMDQAWERCGCDNRLLDPARMQTFYNDPVWLLNGIFIEQHAESMSHRHAIAQFVAYLAPKRVMDFGGGFGTLARLIAAALPQSEISICEPFPPHHGIVSCEEFDNILFVPSLTTESVDVLVSTDVLEHVADPLDLLASMIDAVKPGGYLLIANCFFPVIKCHLPSTFHLRYSFDSFCRLLGLEVLGVCGGSHAKIYRRTRLCAPDWPRLRQMEQRSQLLFPLREWRTRFTRQWLYRVRMAIRHPLHYPRKFLRTLIPST